MNTSSYKQNVLGVVHSPATFPFSVLKQSKVLHFVSLDHLFVPLHLVLLDCPTLLSRRLPGRAQPPTLLLPVCLQHQVAPPPSCESLCPDGFFPDLGPCTTSDPVNLCLCPAIISRQDCTGSPGTCFQAPSPPYLSHGPGFPSDDAFSDRTLSQTLF